MSTSVDEAVRGTLDSMRTMQPGDWIGVDLDGTLAEYESGDYKAGQIGRPIPLMVARVKRWLELGIEVRIFTARVALAFDAKSSHADKLNRSMNVEINRAAIAKWCVEHIGRELPITNIKDQYMHQLWDDRAVRVLFNTGVRADGVKDDH